MAAARKRQIKHILRRKRPTIGKNMVKRMYANSIEIVKENPYKSSLVTVGLSILSGLLLWQHFKK